MDYQTSMQRLCCEENHKALKASLKADERIGEIEMRDGLPGFVFEYGDWTTFRSYTPEGRLVIKKQPKGIAQWYRVSAKFPWVDEPFVDWYFAKSEAEAIAMWQKEARQAHAEEWLAKLELRSATQNESKHLSA